MGNNECRNRSGNGLQHDSEVLLVEGCRRLDFCCSLSVFLLGHELSTVKTLRIVGLLAAATSCSGSSTEPDTALRARYSLDGPVVVARTLDLTVTWATGTLSFDGAGGYRSLLVVTRRDAVRSVVDSQDFRGRFRAFRDSVILVPDSARANLEILYRDPSDAKVLGGAGMGVRYRYIREPE